MSSEELLSVTFEVKMLKRAAQFSDDSSSKFSLGISKQSTNWTWICRNNDKKDLFNKSSQISFQIRPESFSFKLTYSVVYLSQLILSICSRFLSDIKINWILCLKSWQKKYLFSNFTSYFNYFLNCILTHNLMIVLKIDSYYANDHTNVNDNLSPAN